MSCENNSVSKGRRYRGCLPATRGSAVLLLLCNSGCLTERHIVHSTTVPKAQYLAPPTAPDHVAVLVSTSGGMTQAVVTLSGRCARIETGENYRVVEERSEVSVVTLVVTALFAASAMVVYVAPDTDTEASMIGGTALLAGAGIAYGLPALLQSSKNRELPPRRAERFLGGEECALSPIIGARVTVHQPSGVLEGRTDERGVAVLKGELGGPFRVFVDNRPVTHVSWHTP